MRTGRPALDFSGKVFSRLTVLRKNKKADKATLRMLWLVVDETGAELLLDSQVLKRLPVLTTQE